jgi:hypothetical protein
VCFVETGMMTLRCSLALFSFKIIVNSQCTRTWYTKLLISNETDEMSTNPKKNCYAYKVFNDVTVRIQIN